MLSALIRKADEAKPCGESEYVVRGSSTPMREFMYVDDLADACMHLIEVGYTGPLVNIGTGEDVPIRELAETVVKVVGFTGKIVFDAIKLDETPWNSLEIKNAYTLGWNDSTRLTNGICQADAAYQCNVSLQNNCL